MKMYKCNNCGATFALDRDLDPDDVVCPVLACGGDDLVEFEEVDDEDDDDEQEDEPQPRRSRRIR